MIERAYGKINLSINITGKRADGYHLLDMITVPLNFYDVLEMKQTKNLKYVCNIKELKYNEKNIIYRCIEALREKYPFEGNFYIRLKKVIPYQAGLGGGSADGAAALKLVNKLKHLNLSLEQLAEVGLSVGADIPFFIYNQPARIKGIGEVIEPFSFEGKIYCLLIKPQHGINTKIAYSLMDINKCSHPDIDALQQALINQQQISAYLGNSLMYCADQLVEEVGQIIEECKQLGFNDALMSGSGSCCFVLDKDKSALTKLAKIMKEKHKFVYLTSLRNNKV